MKTIRSKTSLLALAVSAALGFSALSVHAGNDYWTSSATGTWSTAASWSAGVPTSGDDVFIGTPSPGVATAAGTFSIDSSPVLNTLNLSDSVASGSTNWTFSGLTSARVLTLNSGINYNALSNHSISATNLSVLLGGNNLWKIDTNFNATPQGSTFTGFSVAANISDGGNAYGITKTGARALTLSGSNSFTGDLTLKRSTIFTGGATNTSLGAGRFVFANDATGSNTGGVSLGINSSGDHTFANNFVNNNANANGSNAASISQGSQASFNVNTFSGTFTTGASYNSAQVLNLSANGNGVGTSEGTFAFSGSWSGYNAVATTNGVRLSGSGTIQLNSAASFAPTNYSFTSGDTTAAAKLLTNVASNFTVNQTVSFSNAANTRRNVFGAISSGFTTTLAGDTSGTAVNIGASGANLVAASGAGLTISGKVTTSTSGGSLVINDGYTYTASLANTLVTPTGTVTLSANTNDYTGGTRVANGTLLVTNTTGSATGTGAVTVGSVGAVSSAQAGVNAATSRVITGVSNATAATLQIGQSITGTGISAGAVITGITIGATTATISIDKTITAANATTVAFSTTAFTSSAILGGTGIIAPTGANGITVNSGSSINPGLAAATGGNLRVNLGGTTGALTLSTGATLTFDLNSASQDKISFWNYAGASDFVINSNVVNIASASNPAVGNYTLFDFYAADGTTPTASGITSGLSLGTLPSGWAASLVFNTNTIDVNITAVPEPSTYIGGSLILGLAAFSQRKRLFSRSLAV